MILPRAPEGDKTTLLITIFFLMNKFLKRYKDTNMTARLSYLL